MMNACHRDANWRKGSEIEHIQSSIITVLPDRFDIEE